MTQLLSRSPRDRAPRRLRRPAASRHPETTRRPAVTVVGAFAAVRAAGLGVLAVMVVVLVGWATAADSGADATDAVATGLQGWLLAHHARLVLPGGAFGLTPLGLTLLPLGLLHAATVRAARQARVSGRRGVLELVSSVTASYAVIATLVAVVSRTEAVRVGPVSAFLGAVVVGLLASGSGAVRATGGWAAVRRRLPEGVRAALPSALGALAVLVAGGTLLVGASLAVHRSQAVALVEGLEAGVGGAVLLGLLAVLYVPTAVVWGLSYVVGPGFAVGAGTSVAATGTDLGAVPAFPLLAALPQEPGPPWGPLVLAVPVTAGVVAALLARRAGVAGAAGAGGAAGAARQPGAAGQPGAGGQPGDMEQPAGWWPLARLCGTVGALVAAAVAVLAVAASGPAGPGRLLETGPTWWLVGLAAAVEVAASMAAALAVFRGIRDRPR